MLHVIYGEDAYGAGQVLADLRDGYRKKVSRPNVIRFESEKLETGDVKQAISSRTLFGERSFLVLRDVLGAAPKEAADQLRQILESRLPLEHEVVFVESGDFDKRGSLWRFLKSEARVHECKPLMGEALNLWVRDEVESQGSRIDNLALEQILLLLGENRMRLWQAITMLTTYTREITKGSVDLLLEGSREEDIFRLTDALGRSDSASAWKVLHNRLKAGDNPLQILGLIIYHFRALVMVKELIEDRVRFQKIASLTRLHPYVVQKLARQVHTFSQAKLKQVYSTLLTAEDSLKRGKTEPAIILDLLVLDTAAK